MRQIPEYTGMVLNAFRKHNPRQLRKMNDDILNIAATDLSKPYFSLAVYSYILSKIVSKPRYFEYEYVRSISEIESSLAAIANRRGIMRDDEADLLFARLERSIASLESKDPRFVIDLLTKGRLKMAAILYAKGMSLGVATQMTGLEKQEILNYAGQTMMFDRIKDAKTAPERMKFARKFLEE